MMKQKLCLTDLALVKKKLLSLKSKIRNSSPSAELNKGVERNYFDARLCINKNKFIRPKRASFEFVSKLTEITPLNTHKFQAKEPIPEVEWWDIPLLQAGNYADVADNSTAVIEDILRMEKITIYVEHHEPLIETLLPSTPPPQPIILTSKERKKLRTLRRVAREQDRRGMIRKGLMEEPKRKVKISNIMTVLGPEAIQEPTKLEKRVREEGAQRVEAHVDRNLARKLTPFERAEKKERKLFDDPNNSETIVSVYKINDVLSSQNRFKVDINAQQNRLSGCAVFSKGFSVVVVEGGSKSIKRYGKLMLRRVNWCEEKTPNNKCVLVWQGSVAKPNFDKFSVHECPLEGEAKDVFVEGGVGHYWDLAASLSDDQV